MAVRGDHGMAQSPSFLHRPAIASVARLLVPVLHSHKAGSSSNCHRNPPALFCLGHPSSGIQTVTPIVNLTNAQTRTMTEASNNVASGLKLKFGFLGLGIMGLPMARNLQRKGFDVTVWNRTLAKCEELVAEGATSAATAAEVVRSSDITFAMLSDPSACLAAVFGEGGVLEGIAPGKGYVDMSTVDSTTSQKIAQAVIEKGGRFLEAPVSGSKKPAEDGALIILAAGDKGLYDESLAAFGAMGKKAHFLGEVGNGANMKLVVNMIMGTMVTGLAEGMALSEKAGLDQQTLLDVLDLGAMACPLFRLKGPAMLNSTHSAAAFPLKHQQKDLRLALLLGDSVDQPLPVASAANEVFKAAKALGHADHDMAGVYTALRTAPPTD
eukprot:TRINITY_DN3652_c0_g1_i2.p1 TRINITY_DN3652_c0_g1~~TRINITY_DN3652_c0_g1_i2.p1  ORF type:complete len:382 (+),score=103.88 TRINITY_DN3652_c0_g1_i2:80-1225(+)